MDNSQIIVAACIVVIFVCLGVIYSIVRNLIRRVADNQNVWLSYETDKLKSELRQSGNPNLPQMKKLPEPPKDFLYDAVQRGNSAIDEIEKNWPNNLFLSKYYRRYVRFIRLAAY
jgi:hypothetical protein